jgi:hypothetical protein
MGRANLENPILSIRHRREEDRSRRDCQSCEESPSHAASLNRHGSVREAEPCRVVGQVAGCVAIWLDGWPSNAAPPDE